MTEQRLKDFENLLASHDWFYHFSDDYSVYKRGHDKQGRINEMYRVLRAEELDVEADALYTKYEPKTHQSLR